MVTACKCGLIAHVMKVLGATIKPMARVSSSMLTAMFTMVSGRMIKLKAREHTLTLTALTMKDSGWMISNTVRVLRAGLMVQDMKVIMKTERRKDPANLLSLTAASTKANSERMKSLEKADTSGPMARLTKDSGKRIKCTEMVFSSGRTERDTKEISLMTSVKAKVLSFGLTADAISEDGELVSKMEKEPTLIRKTRLAEVFGRMAARCNGLTEALLELMLKWTTGTSIEIYKRLS
jgi:hypothetical protein